VSVDWGLVADPVVEAGGQGAGNWWSWGPIAVDGASI